MEVQMESTYFEKLPNVESMQNIWNQINYKNE